MNGSITTYGDHSACGFTCTAVPPPPAVAEPRGWFADESDPEDAVAGSPWQPFVQVDGACFPLPLWFATRDDCEWWINENLPHLGRRFDSR